MRKRVRIDEEKCNGCRACILACAEGALKIIDGKAKLISENCAGLVHMARQAILASGNVIPFKDITISIQVEQKAG